MRRLYNASGDDAQNLHLFYAFLHRILRWATAFVSDAFMQPCRQIWHGILEIVWPHLSLQLTGSLRCSVLALFRRGLRLAEGVANSANKSLCISIFFYFCTRARWQQGYLV